MTIEDLVQALKDVNADEKVIKDVSSLPISIILNYIVDNADEILESYYENL